MVKLVCFGDSITARNEGAPFPRLTSNLEQIFPDWIIINSGVAGNNTFDALKRIESDVLIHKPDLVTILPSTDGMKFIIGNEVNELTEDKFNQWMDFHLKTCEDKSILGSSEHGLIIARKL